MAEASRILLPKREEKIISPAEKHPRAVASAYLRGRDSSQVDDVVLPRIPKRKLSVFYGSFDVITPINYSEDQEGSQETAEVCRSMSTPSIRTEEKQAEENTKDKMDNSDKTDPPGMLNTKEKITGHSYPSVLESSEASSGTSSEHSTEKFLAKDIQRSTAHAIASRDISQRTPNTRDGRLDDHGVHPVSFGRQSGPNTAFENFKGALSMFTTMERENMESGGARLNPSLPANLTSTNMAASRGSLPQGIAHYVLPKKQKDAVISDSAKNKVSEHPGASVAGTAGAKVVASSKSTDAVDDEARGVEMSSWEESLISSESESEAFDFLHQTRSESIAKQRNRHRGRQNNGRPQDNGLRTPHVTSLPTADTLYMQDTRRINGETAELVLNSILNHQRGRGFRDIRRSLSEGEKSDCWGTGSRNCPYKIALRGASLMLEEEKIRAFPSLTDAQTIPLSNQAELVTTCRGTFSESDLEQKYTEFSVGLSTDRITLHRRISVSLRQRDFSERNFCSEVRRMQHDIKDLMPLCKDRESIERVERVENRLDMITRCARRISCTAETLGAVNQEHRISMAILIADKYLQVLRSRCESLAAEVAETKRILLKNNIVTEEVSGELGDDLPRIRYRSGLPMSNRSMMPRRRASIATISRTLPTTQDITKDGPRQRNSVSGRMSLPMRRPSLCSEPQKWENDNLNRTDSNSSISELRDIFEQAESRRTSLEENNNVMRIDQCTLLTVDDIKCTDTIFTECDTWLSKSQDPQPVVNMSQNRDNDFRFCIRTTESLRLGINLEWRSMLWYILIFFLGFYVKHVISTINPYEATPDVQWWSIEKVHQQYFNLSRTASPVSGER